MAVWGAVDCYACANMPSAESCQACGGTGEHKLDRCPWHYVGAAERLVCEVVPAWVEHGTNPLGCAPTDWPATFADAVGVVSGEYAVIRDRAMQKGRKR